MLGRKWYVILLIFCVLIAALGVWAMMDGAIAWRQRPRVDIGDGMRTRQVSPHSDALLAVYSYREGREAAL